MKKIFYSIMAVALCACSQSDVDDNVVAPQPENNGLKFTVVDNGFVNEDGTRVSYGEGTSAQFVNGDVIGIFAIKSAGAEGTTYTTATPYTPTDDAYTVSNAKLTLTNGTWVLTDAAGNANVDFGEADLLLAYRPYRDDATIPAWTDGDYVEGRPSFIGAKGSWDINTVDNRFFVHPYNKNWDTSTIENYEFADWMGDAASIDSNTKTVTFNMIHMRGMIELTTDKNVVLTDMKVGFGENATGNTFTPYFVNENDPDRTQNIYRTLTTEYRNALTIYATIQDENIVKKYKKVINEADYKKAGVRYRVNIAYTPAPTIEVGNGTSLAAALAGMNPTPTTLRLKGELTTEDWATLQGLALTSLDMFNLTNTEIPGNWMKNTTLSGTLTSLVLPKDLTTIKGDALQFPDNTVISIELPASVTTVEAGAFYSSNNVSVRIPEDSQLQTIGQGAFVYTKAVYTDPASVNVLKIPASVTKIDGAAFGGITELKKVIFQSETAPEIVNGAYAATFNDDVKVYVPNNTYKGKFTTGMTIYVGPGLTASNFNTPYTWNGSWADGIGLAGLCDGVTGVNGTHWHSQYSGTYGEWGIYIDITLPTKATGYNPLTVSYTTRAENGNGAPTKVRMAVSSDGETFTQVGDDFTTATLPGGNETITLSSPITVGTNNIVRFAILEAKGTAVGAQSANLAELMLYEETWIEE